MNRRRLACERIQIKTLCILFPASPSCLSLCVASPRVCSDGGEPAGAPGGDQVDQPLHGLRLPAVLRRGNPTDDRTRRPAAVRDLRHSRHHDAGHSPGTLTGGGEAGRGREGEMEGALRVRRRGEGRGQSGREREGEMEGGKGKRGEGEEMVEP